MELRLGQRHVPWPSLLWRSRRLLLFDGSLPGSRAECELQAAWKAPLVIERHVWEQIDVELEGGVGSSVDPALKPL